MANEKQYRLWRTGCPDLCFRGELIAEISSQGENEDEPLYSGAKGCWEAYRLYRTYDRQWIASIDLVSSERTLPGIFHAVRCFEKSDIVKFFGQGELARAFYEKLKGKV